MAFSLLKVGRSFSCYKRNIRNISTSLCDKYPETLPEKLIDSDVPATTQVVIDPLKHPDFFGVRKLFTIKDLFDSRVHLGHMIGSMNDQMKPYIFGSRLNHLIIDLDKTAGLLREALNFTAHIAFRNGVILFISRHAQTAIRVEEIARECGETAHTRLWKEGTFTNTRGVFRTPYIRLPDLIVFLHTLSTTNEEHGAVTESAKLLIPTVGIVDTNCSPNLITYPVPGNDDTPEAIELYLKVFKEAILLGKAKRKEMLQQMQQDTGKK